MLSSGASACIFIPLDPVSRPSFKPAIVKLCVETTGMKSLFATVLSEVERVLMDAGFKDIGRVQTIKRFCWDYQ